MLIGLDKNKNRISAKDAQKGNEYRCPICNELLELRKGEVRIAHFAHWKKSTCLDTWSHDMSEWHYSWQEQFPVDCQEVVVEKDGKKHRADVLIKEHDLVVEFQHSRLTPEEFKERNDFYTGCGYHVIWLFDMTEDFEQGRFVVNEENNLYYWKRPKVTFQNENATISRYYLDNKVDVFFQHNEIIDRLLEYDSERKFIKTSALDYNRNFSWSKHTFLMMLRKTNHKSYISAPNCPKCRIKMVLRTTSWGEYVWGCQNFMVKGKDCREMKVLGRLPINVTEDDSCPFCDGKLRYNEVKVYCENCDYSIRVVIN